MSNNCYTSNVELASSMTIESGPAPVPSGKIKCKPGYQTTICNGIKGSSSTHIREVMKSCCLVTENNGLVYPKPTNHISSKCINDK